MVKDFYNNIIESPDEMFWRVARCLAGAERENINEWAEKFHEIMSNLDFLPNSPTLMNAGRPLGMLSACFVLPLEDSMDSIFTTLRDAAITQKAGGGCGFSFGKIRPKGDIVRSTHRSAGGPVEYLKIFDRALEIIKQGGTRHGANMSTMHITHPDVLEFIDCKRTEGEISNFNISVTVTDEFMHALRNNRMHYFVNPRTGTICGEIKASDLFDKIVDSAWHNGEPGVIFIDEINRHNPTPHVGMMHATNPCFSGDTVVWTADGHKTFKELVRDGKDILVLSQRDDGRLVYRTMRPRLTRKNARLVRVTLDDGSVIKCTPEHKFYLKDGSTQEAQNLVPKTSLASVYRWKANSKGYLRISNGLCNFMEHHIPFEQESELGRKIHVHHKNGNKIDNRPCNLELIARSRHAAVHIIGDKNPVRRFPECNIFNRLNVEGSNNPSYRHDVDDERLGTLRQSGLSYGAIAARVGCSKYTVMKRLGWNHKVVSVRFESKTQDVYCGTVEDTHKFFVATDKDSGVLVSNCGEQPLLPNEACNLGSINLSNFVENGEVDWVRLGVVVRIATRLLDNVVDMNRYPTPSIESVCKANRKVGLGVMGFADMLIKMHADYDSDEALMIGGKVMRFINEAAIDESERLSQEKGVFPNYYGSLWHTIRARRVRNATLTTVAPTGTISLIANCSSGIEPRFGKAIQKNILGGSVIESIDPSLDNEYFIDASRITPEWHVKIQAAFQAHVHAAISKTCNLPNSATRSDVKTAFIMAHNTKCKSITVYRDGSRVKQVLVRQDTNGAPVIQSSCPTGGCEG